MISPSPVESQDRLPQRVETTRHLATRLFDNVNACWCVGPLRKRICSYPSIFIQTFQERFCILYASRVISAKTRHTVSRLYNVTGGIRAGVLPRQHTHPMHTHRIIVGEKQTLPGFDDLFVFQTSSLHLSDMLSRMLMLSNCIETKGMRL